MSARPRFAGDGVLRRPLWVERPADGEPLAVVAGRIGEDAYDPFERVEGDLLLAEAFARLDLGDPDTALGWFERHGVPDLAWFLPGEDAGSPVLDVFADRLDDVAAEQANVAWHLASLARLSDHLAPPTGEGAPGPWDRAWARPLLRVGTYLSRDGRGAWPHDEGAPEVRVVARIGALSPERQADVGRAVTDVLNAGLGPGGPRDLATLQARLMAPYVEAAATSRVGLGWEDRPEAPLPVLLVREARSWGSLLAPVYLQLLEALRRVTEGQRGAAFCKECGQPFLTLDARRSSFCTDRERYRYGQRQFRRRAGAKPRTRGSREA